MTEEQTQRFLTEAEEAIIRQWLQEQQGWDKLTSTWQATHPSQERAADGAIQCQEGSEQHAPRTRHRARTQLYQSQEEDRRERERRRKDREAGSDRPRQHPGEQHASEEADKMEVEEAEEESHNWEEGARIGEAQNPGPHGQHRGVPPHWSPFPNAQPGGPSHGATQCHLRPTPATTHPGPTHQGRVEATFRHETDGVASGPCQPGPQGSLQRGIAPAPAP